MALFTDTIKGQIATLNAVNEQMQRQQELALKQYITGKQYGDDNLIGIGMRDLGNQGLIANTLARTSDAVRGALRGVGVPVAGYERYVPDLEADTTGFIPGGPPVLTDEQKRLEALSKEYRGKSAGQVIRINARKTLQDMYRQDDPKSTREPTEEEIDSFINTHLRPAGGKGYIKRYRIKDEGIRELYGRQAATADDMRVYKLVQDVDKEHREYQKKHGTYGMTEFTGNRANKENQAYKFFKSEYDYWAGKKNWNKAQEAQRSYERNMKNIYDYYGDKNYPKEWSMLGARKGVAHPKNLTYQTVTLNNGRKFTYTLSKDDINNPNAIALAIAEMYSVEDANAYLKAISQGGVGVHSYRDASKTDVPQTQEQEWAAGQLLSDEFVDKAGEGGLFSTKEGNIKRSNRMFFQNINNDNIVYNKKKHSIHDIVRGFKNDGSPEDLSKIQLIRDLTGLSTGEIEDIILARLNINQPPYLKTMVAEGDKGKTEKESQNKEKTTSVFIDGKWRKAKVTAGFGK